MKIYVVIGYTGEYSDRTEWLVKAFNSEDAAKEHVLSATKRAKEIEATREDRYRSPKAANEFDPLMQMDYTGTYYNYESVELV